MKNCVMCAKEFEEKALDFLGRCEDCFSLYMRMSDDEQRAIKGKLGVPYSPIYNGKDKYGF